MWLGGYKAPHGREARTRPRTVFSRAFDSLKAFIDRQLASSWATPTLICLALFVALFAIAGETATAPFVYAPPPQ